MLGKPVRRADDVEAFSRGSVFIERSSELLDYRIVGLIWVQRILNRALDWFVILWEWSIGKSGERTKDPADSFSRHDERSHVVFGSRVRLDVRDVVAHPTLQCLIPPV